MGWCLDDTSIFIDATERLVCEMEALNFSNELTELTDDVDRIERNLKHTLETIDYIKRGPYLDHSRTVVAPVPNWKATPTVMGPNGGLQTGSKNFYTPPTIVNIARYLMGGIDLDPCSDTQGNIIVNATQFYSADGLSRPWGGRCLVNPPGSTTTPGMKRKQGPDAWWDKLIAEFDEGHVTSGFYVSFALDRMQTSQKADGVGILQFPTFIPNKRIAYYASNGQPTKAPPKPSCFTWVSEHADLDMLEEVFHDNGIAGIAVQR